MKLALKNIGRIEKAEVEINRITVIAGENNTGKSTVGRALFAVFNSFFDLEHQIEAERIQNIDSLISMMYRNLTNRVTRRFDVDEISQSIVKHIDQYKNNPEAIKDIVLKAILQYDENFEKHLDNNGLDEFVARINEGLMVSDKEIFSSVLSKRLDAEFNGQINNIFLDNVGEIVLTIKDTVITVSIKHNNIRNVTGDIDLHTEVVYIDDPFILDETRYVYYGFDRNYLDHRGQLRMKLVRDSDLNLVDEIIASNKLESIYEKISMVCSGDLIKSKRFSLGYQRKDSDKILDAKNLSSGFKTFAILKALLLNSTIEYNGTLILDEPEIHLHPEWQLIFAELIVLIQKEFCVHVLLNTHSPYFLNAIEVYTEKYGVSDGCKYYLATSKGDVSSLEDVTNCTEAIYHKLARPLQVLENERGRL